MNESRIVAVVGATATGKTALGERLAERLGGQVVCADSRQVYRELQIGTGKPSRAELARAPHHLFDALSLGQHGSAGWFARAAAAVCTTLHRDGLVPVLVGGSGLYLRALQSGLSATPPHDPHIRLRLGAEVEAHGIEVLHARLTRLDPEAAARLKRGDTQRIVRALEVLEASGKPLSWWHRAPAEPLLQGAWRVIEVCMPPRMTADRIARRTHWMFENGLIEETRRLIEAGHEPALRALRAVGYDEALDLWAGRLEASQAEARVNVRTRQLAKRQRTWFRHQVEAVRLDAAGLGDAELLAGALEAASG